MLPGVCGGFASVQPGQIFGGQPPPPFDPEKNLAIAMASDKQHQLLDPRLGRIKRRAAVGALDDDDDNAMELLQIQPEHRTLTNAVSQLAAQMQSFGAVAQQLQPLAQDAPALLSIVKEWQLLVGHVSPHEAEIQRLDSELQETHAMIKGRDGNGPALGDEASLYMENRDEIRISSRKLELTVGPGLEQSAAEEEMKQAIAATDKTLDVLKGKFSGEEFDAAESFTAGRRL